MCNGCPDADSGDGGDCEGVGVIVSVRGVLFFIVRKSAQVATKKKSHHSLNVASIRK